MPERRPVSRRHESIVDEEPFGGRSVGGRHAAPTVLGPGLPLAFVPRSGFPHVGADPVRHAGDVHPVVAVAGDEGRSTAAVGSSVLERSLVDVAVAEAQHARTLALAFDPHALEAVSYTH